MDEEEHNISFKEMPLPQDICDWKLVAIVPYGSNAEEIEARICTEKICIKRKRNNRNCKRHIKIN